jgi:hypothetical protein
LRFIPGERHSYKTEFAYTKKFDNDIGIGEQRDNVDLWIDEWTESVDKHVAVIWRAPTRIKITTTPAGVMRGAAKVNYDSMESDSDPGPFLGIAQLVGVAWRFSISDAGDVLSCHPPAGVDEFTLSVMRRSGMSFGAELPPLPATRKHDGDSWSGGIRCPIVPLGDACIVRESLRVLKSNCATINCHVDTGSVSVLPDGGIVAAYDGIRTLDVDAGIMTGYQVLARLEDGRASVAGSNEGIGLAYVDYSLRVTLLLPTRAQ